MRDQCVLTELFLVPFFSSGLRKHDVCFLITVRPTLLYGTRFDRRQLFREQTGLVYVRGCEVQGMLDDKGRVIEEGTFNLTPAVFFLLLVISRSDSCNPVFAAVQR